MSLLILVVDDEPDVEVLFRQQFRRDLRADRFTMEFAQSAPMALVPRYRYDQLMRLGWKVFLPISLAMIVFGAIRAFDMGTSPPDLSAVLHFGAAINQFEIRSRGSRYRGQGEGLEPRRNAVAPMQATAVEPRDDPMQKKNDGEQVSGACRRDACACA
jgi:NADH dehydrogenase